LNRKASKKYTDIGKYTKVFLVFELYSSRKVKAILNIYYLVYLNTLSKLKVKV